MPGKTPSVVDGPHLDGDRGYPPSAATTLTAGDLAQMSLRELEHAWCTYPCAPLSGGVWEGHYIYELPMSAPKRLLSRAMFKWRHFGIDFDHHKWWFREPSRLVAQFEPIAGPSRWRDADVIRLHYERTGPRFLRQQLYDELKPLNDQCMLAIGGSNNDTLRGTWFYFALSPLTLS